MALWQKIYYKLLNLPLSAWVNTQCIPSEPVEQLNLSLARPIVYVLPFQSHTDLLTLRRTCLRQGLPDPLTPLTIGDVTLPRYVFISHGRKVFSGDDDLPARSLAHFKDLLHLHRQDSELDIQLVPASVLWQRDPGNETQRHQAILRAMNGPEKLWTILTRGRDGMVRLSQAVSLRYMADKHGTDQAIAHKLARVAMIHFSRQKLAASGPRLPNRGLLFKRLLASKAIDKVVHDEAQTRDVSVDKVRKEAVDMMEEIAANFSYRLIRYSDRILTWLWNKLYQGIHVNNAERVRQLAQDGHEIVYVPCHRSHMDYLLLSYVLYKEGLVPPHIAAGVNLNFFPAGPLFRRGGAFFIRRSFKGNRLYSTVFREYLAELFARGYSVEYFAEGGRSRTGRLLPAKTGMLAMTLQAMLRGQQRPITLVPVYIGYEHVMEVNTYAKELQGQRKEKESVGQVLGIVRKLRNYGLGYVNFGEPIALNQHLNEQVPDWHDYINPMEPQKPAWMNPVVSDLATKVMTHINDAAATNALNLCATALLASRQRALSREALEAQLGVYQALLTQAPYSASSSVPQDSPADLVDHALSLNKLVVEKDTMGEVISLDRQQAILMTYYRNNVIHLVALPSLIAQILVTHKSISRSGLRACVQQLYPLLKAELFMSFDQAGLESYFEALLHAMHDQSLLCCDDGKVTMNNAKLGELQLLGRTIAETLQRYAITLTLFSHQPHIDKRDLEKHSQMLAQRLSRLHGINAPEFFDKRVFSIFVDTLREQGYLDDDAKANAERIAALNDLVCELISPEVQLTIQAVLNQPLNKS